MKKFNFRKEYKNNNSGLSNKTNNKNKISNRLNKIEIKPQFLVIGLVVIITVISLIYFIFLKYSPIMNFKYEGYGISGKQITDNLLGASGDKENRDSQKSNLSDDDGKNASLAKIEEQGTIFKKLNSYFIGSKEKTEIDLSYPIYINDKNTIYNLNQDITLISKNFEQVAGYPNISITDGKVYNGNSLERADSKEYIFAKTTEGIYINLKEIKINTTANEYVLPVNSLVVLEENAIRYYSVRNNILVFNEINDVDYNSQIIIKNIENNDLDTNGQNIQNEQNTVNSLGAQGNPNTQKVDNQYNYEELLTRLGIMGNAKNDVENSQEEIEKEETFSKEEQIDEKEENKEEVAEPIEPENKEEIQNNTKFVKPKVTAEGFKAEVYSAKSRLQIKDPAGRIIEAPTFEIYKEGKIYLRRIFKASGDIQITGLVPDTEYEIVGKYIYLNEENKKIENTFYKGTIKTKGYEALGAIILNKEEGEIYSNKIQIKSLKITSDINAEEVKGINQVEIETGEIKTVIKNDKVNELLQGKEVTIESSEGLKSNAKVGYKIRFYDKNGKELKVENNEGKSKTSKQKPTVRVAIKEQDIVSVTLGLRLTNRDKVKLENYKCIITKPNGEIIKEERLSENEKEIKLEDLDQNQYYKITIYADFNLNDNKGIKEKEEIGNLVFATKPIATLGSLELKVENKETTNKSAKIAYKIDEERTDKRLIQILNELTIKIIETPQDSEGNVNKEEDNDEAGSKEREDKKVVYTNTLTKEEIKNLQLGETKELNYEQLKSNTTYKIEITGNIELGNTKEEVPVTYTYNKFTTLKIPAKVEIKNQFVTGNLIDLDVKIKDKDNSVLNNKVRVELRDEKNNLIDLQEIETNKEYVRKTYEKLEENKTYTLNFYADQYNEGSTNETYKINYLIKTVEIVTEPGISGEIGLTELKREGTGKNLIDITSKINWRGIYFNTHNYYGKEYNEKTNELKLYCKSSGGQGQRYLYDLSEYVGKTVTMSFKIKKDAKAQINIYSGNRIVKDITNKVNESWSEYKYTIAIENDGLLGFEVKSINDENAWMYLKDVQIELGDKSTAYEGFKYNLVSVINAKIIDKRNETGKYYIKEYENNILINEKEYNKDIHTIEEFIVNTNNTYKFVLTIQINGREYVLDSYEFTTENDKEIKGINSLEEYRKTINPEGNYIVFCDLDFRNIRDYENMFGTANYGFKGKIDFNGHKIIRDTSSNIMLMNNIEKEGIIENFELEIYLDNEVELNFYNGLFNTNQGKVSNFKVILKESTNKANIDIELLGSVNYGTIENFVIESDVNLYGVRVITMGVAANYGTIKNGYAYGENVQGIYPFNETTVNRDIAVVNIDNEGTIENIFSLINVDVENNIKTINNVGNIISYSVKSGINKNLYSVGYGKNVTTSCGPTIGIANKSENVYYFADKIFTNTANKKNTPLALWDVTFQEQILNSDEAFYIENLIEQGYYPQLNWPKCMPKQAYIKLPEVKDKDLPDIVSTEILENTNNTAKVKFSVNNPSGETITNIKIKNLECKIERQEYKNGKSEVFAILSNPIICVSNYEIISISSKGAYNKEYTRKFEEKERLINISFYREVNSTEDWKDINKSTSENYILMQDLDFRNNPNDAIIWNSLKGTIDGNGHTIKNVRHNTAAHIIYGEINEIKNINFENISLENVASWGGIIRQTYKASNIYANNIKIIVKRGNTVETTHGGLIEFVAGEVINCGINNVTIINNVSNSTRTRIGGLIGVANYAKVENCFATNVKIQTKNTNYEGVGGLIGASEERSSIKNCYTTGNIEIDGGYAGGIVGLLTNYSEVINSYSYININGEVYNAGGIAGATSNFAMSKNNIALGNLYTTRLNTKLGRILGSGDARNTNYAYSNQRINGLIEPDSYETNIKLLSAKELLNKNTYSNLNYGNAFNYSELEKGILPKLNKINEDGTYSNEILEKQEDIYLEISNELKIENIVVEKSAVNEIAGQIVVINTNGIEIVGLDIDGMNVNIEKIVNNAGKTYITITANPSKYYDTYKIIGIKYKENNEIKNKEAEGKIQIQFFKELYNFEDWQSIEKGTYQNYKLMNDINFKGKKDINTNVTMARLEGNNGKKKLENVDIVLNEEKSGFINEISTNIEDIDFENVKITNAKEGNMTGIIGQLNGKMRNVDFNNITIEAPKMNNTGIIGENGGDLIENINENNIEIKGKNKTGSLIGYVLKFPRINNIYADKIRVEGNDYTAGVIGYAENGPSSSIGKIDISNAEVIGNNYTGGVIGYAFMEYAEKQEFVNIKDSTIVGKGNYVGGMYGESYNIIKSKATNIKVEGYGDNIGGISGKSNQHSCFIYDSYVKGKGANSNNVGGLFGVLQHAGSDYKVVGTKISTTGSNVGSIFGVTKADTGNIIAINCDVEGYSNVGGNIGKLEMGNVKRAYNNSNVVSYSNNAGGIIGYLENGEMIANSKVSSVQESYTARGKVESKTNVGGLIGNIQKELYMPEKYFYSNYVDINLVSEEISSISLGIGNMPNQNQYLNDTYFYKYSKINGENPDRKNSMFIPEAAYLKEEDLKRKETYTGKMKWTGNWDYNVLKEGKYPALDSKFCINLPKDEENVVTGELTTNKENFSGKYIETKVEEPHYTFNYNGKIIKTYETYSEIISEDNSRVVRQDIRLYVKDGNLYGLPVELDLGNSAIKLVENNFIIDLYNGKEYETVLGTDGKIYDLKEPLKYPENFVNNGIKSIGNNLDYVRTDNESSNKEENLHEVEVIYINGDKLKFNYQTGEVISSIEEKQGKTGLFDYMKEKISELGNLNSVESQEITNKYKESKVLQSKLEETPVEEALKEQSNNTNKIEDITNGENDKANNSLKERKYINIYNAEKDEYQIYQEKELLDTTKQEVVSENDKIEANNLKEYYASEGKSRNKNMGILWITLSIVGVVIILFAIKKRD